LQKVRNDREKADKEREEKQNKDDMAKIKDELIVLKKTKKEGELKFL
jgi:hypothetical protein